MPHLISAPSLHRGYDVNWPHWPAVSSHLKHVDMHVGSSNHSSCECTHPSDQVLKWQYMVLFLFENDCLIMRKWVIIKTIHYNFEEYSIMAIFCTWNKPYVVSPFGYKMSQAIIKWAVIHHFQTKNCLITTEVYHYMIIVYDHCILLIKHALCFIRYTFVVIAKKVSFVNPYMRDLSHYLWDLNP